MIVLDSFMIKMFKLEARRTESLIEVQEEQDLETVKNTSAVLNENSMQKDISIEEAKDPDSSTTKYRNSC